MATLIDIEGIGPTYAAKLEQAGLKTQEQLLEQGADKKGRKAIAEAADISETLILNWVNRADLSRVKGISTQYADLLEEAGVDTVPELKMRNAENLHTKMKEVNDARNLVNKLPGLSQVEDWIAQAKELPRVITH